MKMNKIQFYNQLQLKGYSPEEAEELVKTKSEAELQALING